MNWSAILEEKNAARIVIGDYELVDGTRKMKVRKPEDGKIQNNPTGNDTHFPRLCCRLATLATQNLFPFLARQTSSFFGSSRYSSSGGNFRGQ